MTKTKKSIKVTPVGHSENNSLAGWDEVTRKQGEESRTQVEMQRKFVTQIESETPLSKDSESLLELVSRINSISSMMLHPHRGVTEEVLVQWVKDMTLLREKFNRISALAKEQGLL